MTALPALARLVAALERLPGIGPKSARRIAHGFDSRRMAAQIEDRILEAIAAHAPR